jgi:cytochrome c oxidase subunit 5a
MHDLLAEDLVPEPKIISAALQACRRVNDYALCVRILEAVRNKCGSRVNEIYPYIIQVSIIPLPGLSLLVQCA